jgi:hypothetical protein
MTGIIRVRPIAKAIRAHRFAIFDVAVQQSFPAGLGEHPDIPSGASGAK